MMKISTHPSKWSEAASEQQYEGMSIRRQSWHAKNWLISMKDGASERENIKIAIPLDIALTAISRIHMNNLLFMMNIMYRDRCRKKNWEKTRHEVLCRVSGKNIQIISFTVIAKVCLPCLLHSQFFLVLLFYDYYDMRTCWRENWSEIKGKNSLRENCLIFYFYFNLLCKLFRKC
jgi:hypothetical protein